jgi:hypothetical protein
VIDDAVLTAIEQAGAEATPRPWGDGIVEPSLDQVEWIKECLSYGHGDVWLVIPTEHKNNRLAADGKHFEHAAICSITGNGPTSEQNTWFIVLAANHALELVAEIRRLRHILRMLGPETYDMAGGNEDDEADALANGDYTPEMIAAEREYREANL